MYTKHINWRENSLFIVSIWGHMIYNGTHGNYINTYSYKGYLENKTTIKGIGVWWWLSHKIYYMGKTTDTFGRMKFQLPQTYRLKPKLMLQVANTRYRVIDARFKLHGESSKVFLWNPWNVLTRMHRRKKKQRFLYILG